jgi:alpha-beta hydrolase superfamily lysophospholipase
MSTVRHQDGTFENDRQERIYYQAWLPGGAPRAVVLLVHGLAEHSGRYSNLVEHLVALGYAVCAFDLVGHGHSEGRRAFVRRFDEYSALVHTYLALVRARYPGLPYFCFGHSMGAVVAARYALEYNPALAGLILSGMSCEMPADVTPLTMRLAKVLSALAPWLPVKALESETLSRDPAVVRGYDSDPLVYRGGIPARTGVELLLAQQKVVARAAGIAPPVLMVHGGADRLCPLPAARAFYASLSLEDKTLKVYDELYHEVLNEPERDQVLDDIAAWIEAHL